jgi:hypothetical protein
MLFSVITFLSVTLVHSLDSCALIKHDFEENGCCDGHDMPSNVCWRPHMVLQPFAYMNPAGFMLPGNFYHTSVAQAHLSTDLFTSGMSDTPASRAAITGQWGLSTSANIHINSISFKKMMDNPADYKTARSLLKPGNLLINNPSTGIMYIVNADGFTSDNVDRQDLKFGIAYLYSLCSDSTAARLSLTSLNAGTVQPPIMMDVDKVIGSMLLTHGTHLKGSSVTLKQLADGKEFLILGLDTCWCPTCLMNIGYANMFAENVAGTVELNYIKNMVTNVQIATGFSNKNLWDKLPPECGCIFGANQTTQPPSCQAVTGSCVTKYYLSHGYPFSMIESFIGWYGSTKAPNGGCRVMAVSQYPPIVDDLVNGETTEQFFYNKFPNAYVDIKYDTHDFPEGGQSGFSVVNVTSGELVMKHTTNFQTGKYSPNSRFVVDSLFNAIGRPDLIPKYLSHTQVDATPASMRLGPQETMLGTIPVPASLPKYI